MLRNIYIYIYIYIADADFGGGPLDAAPCELAEGVLAVLAVHVCPSRRRPRTLAYFRCLTALILKGLSVLGCACVCLFVRRDDVPGP